MTRGQKSLIAVAIIIVLWWKVFPVVFYLFKRTLFPGAASIYILVPAGVVFLGLSIAAWKIVVGARKA